MGDYGNGEARRQALGYRYQEVQDFIGHIYRASAQTVAEEEWQGRYGNGDVRRAVLGDRYDEVMAVVNGGDKTVDQLAQEVIRGEWGNGPERRQRLEAAGYDCDAVQARVNQLV